MARHLTTRNLDVLLCIMRRQDADGFMPTVRTIGVELGMASPSTVQAHIDALERLGLVERKGRQRRVTDLGRSVLDVMVTA